MNLLHGDAKFADVVERVVYNGFLSGVSRATGFSTSTRWPAAAYHRKEWYGTACCPVNVVRFLLAARPRLRHQRRRRLREPVRSK